MIGLVDILTLRCRKIREPIENHQSVVLSILATLGLLTKLAEICPKGQLITYKRMCVINAINFSCCIKFILNKI